MDRALFVRDMVMCFALTKLAQMQQFPLRVSEQECRKGSRDSDLK